MSIDPIGGSTPTGAVSGLPTSRSSRMTRLRSRNRFGSPTVLNRALALYGDAPVPSDPPVVAPPHVRTCHSMSLLSGNVFTGIDVEGVPVTTFARTVQVGEPTTRHWIWKPDITEVSVL